MLVLRTSIMIHIKAANGTLWNDNLVYLRSSAGALLLTEIHSSLKEWKGLVAFASLFDIHQFDKLFIWTKFPVWVIVMGWLVIALYRGWPLRDTAQVGQILN